RGYGLDCFRHIQGSYNTYTHNNFIELLISGGIIGFALYYINYIIALTKAYFTGKKGDPILMLMITIMLVILVNEYALVTYYGRGYLIFIVLTIAFTKKIDKKSSYKNYGLFTNLRKVISKV
ncbi:MAG: hypothetical protein GX638_06695, partial [Crenarchaeota archaeon]|nr:hypothetical protein [Thermoproteota archaeon]